MNNAHRHSAAASASAFVRLMSVTVRLLSVIACVISIARSSAAIERYTYDNANRLVKVVYDDSSSIAYTYDANGNIITINARTGSSAVRVAATVPATTAIESITPNPMRDNASVRFRVAAASRVTLALIDVLGRETPIFNNLFSPGTYTSDFPYAGAAQEASRFPAGTYLCVLRAAGSVDVRRIVMLR